MPWTATRVFLFKGSKTDANTLKNGRNSLKILKESIKRIKRGDVHLE